MKNNLDELDEFLATITQPKNKREKGIKFATNDSFGTLDFLREEVVLRYLCKPVQIESENGIKLDGLYITGFNTTDSDYIDNIDNNKPTIIISCPNAAYYELMCLENDWIKFYLSSGLNVFIWNYRGYGRSTGSPTPEGARIDGEAIVDYLRSVIGVRKLGAHGLSIGGVVATHLAKHKGLDYLCCDRNFMSLSKVAELSIGRAAGIIFRFVTQWNDVIV